MLAGLGRLFVWLLSTALGSILLSAGLTLFTYPFISSAADLLASNLVTSLSGVQHLWVISQAGGIDALSIILGALTARASIQAAQVSIRKSST